MPDAGCRGPDDARRLTTGADGAFSIRRFASGIRYSASGIRHRHIRHDAPGGRNPSRRSSALLRAARQSPRALRTVSCRTAVEVARCQLPLPLLLTQTAVCFSLCRVQNSRHASTESGPSVVAQPVGVTRAAHQTDCGRPDRPARSDRSRVPGRRAGGGAPAGSLWELPLPGGLRGALQAVGDPAAADRSQFLLEFIRRVYSGPALPDQAGAAQLRRLLAYLERASGCSRRHGAPGVDSLDTLPLGLPPSVWKRVVASGDATPHDLLTAILQSRNASLLYSGVLSLDDNTRALARRAAGARGRSGIAARSLVRSCRSVAARVRRRDARARRRLRASPHGRRSPELAPATRQHSSGRCWRAMTAASHICSERWRRSPSARSGSCCSSMRRARATG